MAEDHLLPPLLPSKFERLLHAPQANVAIAEPRPRLSVDIAADQDDRAGGNIRQRLQPRNGLQVVGQRETFSRGETLENLGELQNAIGGDGHGRFLFEWKHQEYQLCEFWPR